MYTISFQNFFVCALLLIIHTWNSSPLRSSLLWPQCTCCTVPTTSGRPHRSRLVWACQWPSSVPLSSPQLFHYDSLWALGITKSHREQGLDYREGEELSWCPSWSRLSCGLVYCPSRNATDPIWRVLASSDRISSLKPQHCKPNSKSLANQLRCIDFLTPPTPLIIPHSSPPSLNLLCHSKTDARFMQNGLKAIWSIPYVYVAFFPSLKQNFITYRSSKVSSRHVEIHQRCQSGFSRVYSNCFCNCSFKPEIIKIVQSSHKVYSNNIVNFQESATILNACTRKVWNLIEGTTYMRPWQVLLLRVAIHFRVMTLKGYFILLRAPEM